MYVRLMLLPFIAGLTLAQEPSPRDPAAQPPPREQAAPQARPEPQPEATPKPRPTPRFRLYPPEGQGRIFPGGPGGLTLQPVPMGKRPPGGTASGVCSTPLIEMPGTADYKGKIVTVDPKTPVATMPNVTLPAPPCDKR